MTQPTPLESSDDCSFKKELKALWYWTGFGEKKLWDILQLLIVPIVLALTAFSFQEGTKQRDLQIAEDRTKQETLNRYFDQISTLLFEQKLRVAREGSEVRVVARARTLTAIRDLDDRRNRQLINFLREAKLLEKTNPVISLESADLVKANLSEVNLSETNLRRANLSDIGLFQANLRRANLSDVNLTSAVLLLANLNGADLRRANLSGADLSGANLNGADLRRANLSGADLSRANLNGADMRGADMNGINLSGIDLRGVRLNSNMLKDAFLCETTMLDATKSDRDCDKLKEREKDSLHRFPSYKNP